MKASTVIANIDFTAITPEQIGRCYKVYEGSKAFYQVESEQDSTIEYTVKFSKEWGFTCSCESGAVGFSNVSHPSGVCKHVRWSLAAKREEDEAMAALVAASCTPVVPAPVAPVAKPLTKAEKRDLKMHATRAFSLYR